MKVCSKCHIEKNESEFYKNKKVKTGLSSSCRKCHSIVNKLCFKKRGLDGVEARKKSYKKWYEKNKESAREQQKAWVENNREHYKAIRNTWMKGYRKTQSYEGFKEYIKKYEEKARQDLSDFYIKRVLRVKYGIFSSMVTPDLIELQRNILKIKRETWKK